MSFTYTEDLSKDLDYVRFHTGDVVQDESFLSDEIITSILREYDTKQRAVLEALRFIVTRLSSPNFTADWLTVDNKSAREGYLTVIEEKKKAFGIGLPVATAVHTYRADSAQTEAPDFTDGRPGIDGVTDWW